MTIVTPAAAATATESVAAERMCSPVLPAAASAAGAPPRVVTKAMREEPVPVVVALGDSVTAGVGDSAGPVSGWSAHLAYRLRAGHRNLGRNGARAADVRHRQLPLAVSSGARLATLFVGGNDVLRGDFDPEDVRTDVAATVKTLHRAEIQTLLVLPPTVGPELPAPGPVRRVLARRTEQLRQSLLAAVLSVGVGTPGELLILDAQQVRREGGAPVFHIDRIHPSPTGHRLLAAHAARLLTTGECPGWSDSGRVCPIPPLPSLPLRVGWLVARGLPWLARRSRDLLPELAHIVWREEIAPALTSRP